MDIWFIDYETYWSKDFSLSKMTPVEYILSPLFSVHGAAVMKKGSDPEWIEGPDLPAWFASLDRDNVALVSHNALFDACITAWYYGFIPRLTIDTLGMSRALNGWALKSHSLAKVGEYFGLGGKAEGGAVLNATKGMMLDEIKQSGYYDKFIEYALQDVRLCAAIYAKMRPIFPAQELVIMDMVLRCALNPKFMLDANVLAEHLHYVKNTKENLLAKVGMENKDMLMSNERLASTLMLMGVDVPMKTSAATGKQTYAFSRNDPEFMALLDDDRPEVQMLIAARLGVKSTLEETRTERLLGMSHLTWKGKEGAMMPMPLRYAGAHTHRLSGEWSLNTQNLPRGGALRRALIAPPGHKVITIDSSQIEARIVAWICQQSELVAQFARNEDVYSNFASEVFGFKINKKDNPTERFVGKTGILGLGYGVGWVKFQKTVKLQSKAQTGQQIELTDVEAQGVVSTYRRINSAVPMTWRALDNAIAILAGMKSEYFLGPCKFEEGVVRLPSGLCLHYADLQRDAEGWKFTYGGMRKNLYGGKLLENIVQALARICVMDAAVQIERRFATFGVELAGQAHDELIYVVPDDVVDVCKTIAMEEMRRRPLWALDLPLDAEVGVGQSYGEAK